MTSSHSSSMFSGVVVLFVMVLLLAVSLETTAAASDDSASHAATEVIDRDSSLYYDADEPTGSIVAKQQHSDADDSRRFTALPRIQFQFVCVDHETTKNNQTLKLQDTFNATQMMHDYFVKQHQRSEGDLGASSRLWSTLDVIDPIRTSVKFSTVQDVPTSRYFYGSCPSDMENDPQVLFTVDVHVSGRYDDSDSDHGQQHQDRLHAFQQGWTSSMTADSIQDFVVRNVCTNLTWFDARIAAFPTQHRDKASAASEALHEKTMDHKLHLLCGGGSVTDPSFRTNMDDEYDDEDNGAFFMLAVFVGFAMVGMIYGELQQFGPLPNAAPGSRRRRQRRNDHTTATTPVVTTELEMV